MEWTERQTLHANYEKTGLLLDPNHGFGRNKKSDPLKSKEQRLAEDGETFSDDDGEQPCWDLVAESLGITSAAMNSASPVQP